MTNSFHEDTARDFPDVYNYVTTSLYRRLPYYNFANVYFRQNRIEHAKSITHSVIKCYLVDNVDQFNGKYSLGKLKYLIARDVDYMSVDKEVSKYIQELLHSSATLQKSK